MRQKTKQKLLLLEDVEGLGRSGDVASAKAGFVRNYLLPKKKAVIADSYTLKLQTKLKEEREKKAIVDKEEALQLSARLTGMTISTTVKVDPEGHMYGSVTALDVAKMLQEKGHAIEKRHVILHQPIRTLGTHQVPLRLDEGVAGELTLEVNAEEGLQAAK